MRDITLQCLHLRAEAARRLFFAILRVLRGSGLSCAMTSANGRGRRRSAGPAADDTPHSAPLAFGRARAFGLSARRHVRLRQPHARTHQAAVIGAWGGCRRGGGGGGRRSCLCSAGGNTLMPSAHSRRFPRGRRRSLIRSWLHATHTTWHDGLFHGAEEGFNQHHARKNTCLPSRFYATRRITGTRARIGAVQPRGFF